MKANVGGIDRILRAIIYKLLGLHTCQMSRNSAL